MTAFRFPDGNEGATARWRNKGSDIHATIPLTDKTRDPTVEKYCFPAMNSIGSKISDHQRILIRVSLRHGADAHLSSLSGYPAG